jgi:phosphate-selective porin
MKAQPMARGGLLWCAAVGVLWSAAPAGLKADEVAGAQPVAAEQAGVELGSLARLAQLEAMNGNGGAEEAAPAVLAGYDTKQGFYIRDREGNNVIKLKGQLQFRYTYKAREQRGDERDDPDGDGVVDAGEEIGKEDDSAFEFERLRLGVEGNVLVPELTYRFIFDGDTDGAGTLRTTDALIEYWAGKALGGEDSGTIGLGGGQTKAPFGLQETMSSSVQQFVDRSLANEFFNVDRNVGVWVRGDIGNIYYAFAVTNGIDSVNVSPSAIDNIPAFIGKMNMQFLSHAKKGVHQEGAVGNSEGKNDVFLVGGSFATDQNNQSSGAGGLDFQVYQFGLETLLRLGPFSLQGEYFGRWLDYETGNTAIPGGDGSANFAHGGYVQAGVVFADNWEVAGRVSAVWSDGPQDGNGVEAGPCISWYISGNHKIKWQTDLIFFDISPDLPDSTEDIDGNSAGGNAGANLLSSFNSGAANLQAAETGLMVRTQIQLSF